MDTLISILQDSCRGPDGVLKISNIYKLLSITARVVFKYHHFVAMNESLD